MTHLAGVNAVLQISITYLQKLSPRAKLPLHFLLNYCVNKFLRPLLRVEINTKKKLNIICHLWYLDSNYILSYCPLSLHCFVLIGCQRPEMLANVRRVHWPHAVTYVNKALYTWKLLWVISRILFMQRVRMHKSVPLERRSLYVAKLYHRNCAQLIIIALNCCRHISTASWILK